MKTTKTHIGNFCVDSGQFIIIDPCYLKEWKDGEYDKKDNDYNKCCEQTLHPNNGGETNMTNSPNVIFVASPTRDGDGVYPVYAIRDEKNQLKKIEITFD